MGSGSEPATARAQTRDRLVIRAHRQGESQREAEILEALGERDGPRFRVRLIDTGHETIVYPGSDAFLERPARSHRPRRQGAPR